jgi:DNA-binding CsgD family transcriptional regulator
VGGRRSTRGDVIAVVEAAYDLGADDEQWLCGVVAAAARLFPPGRGAYALTHDPTAGRVRRWRSAGIDAKTLAEMLTALGGGNLDDTPTTRVFPPVIWERMVLPYPRAITLRALFPSRSRDPFMAGMLAAAGNQIGVRGTDERGEGVVLSSPGSPVPGTTPGWPLFERLGTHLAAGYRLRQALGGTPGLGAAEAVFTSAGRLEHLGASDGWEREAAEDAALAGRARPRGRDALARLLARRAARVREAVGPLRRASSARALALWRGLFDGRWSLVGQHDRDGKRFLLAIPNPPEARARTALSRRERQVVALLCAGCSAKQVSYELGLARSTVSGHLKTALRKLRLRNLSELLAFAGAG